MGGLHGVKKRFTGPASRWLNSGTELCSSASVLPILLASCQWLKSQPRRVIAIVSGFGQRPFPVPPARYLLELIGRQIKTDRWPFRISYAVADWMAGWGIRNSGTIAYQDSCFSGRGFGLFMQGKYLLPPFIQ